jgi:hypothetical protein
MALAMTMKDAVPKSEANRDDIAARAISRCILFPPGKGRDRGIRSDTLPMLILFLWQTAASWQWLRLG